MKWIGQRPAGRNEADDQFGSSFAIGDFIENDFQLADLVVGVPGENYKGSGPNAGVVFLYQFGGTNFISPIVLDQTGAGRNERGDKFGTALASGDFNGDGKVDLAVGAPGEDYNGSGPNAGMVFFFKGNGSGVTSPSLVVQNPIDSHESGDRFGQTLVSGNFNNDGFEDLAVSAPGEAVPGTSSRSGAVFLYLGSRDGLKNPKMINQAGDRDENLDLFGASLTVGDFDNDNFDDLVVGVPGEGIAGGSGQMGAIHVFRGKANGFHPARVFDQRPAGRNESGDQFGKSLAVGDFDKDGFDDLAIGAPGENYRGSGPNSGVVFVAKGSASGLGNMNVFGQDPGGRNESGDRFGYSLIAGDFNGDSFEDLAIGTPGENYRGSGPNAGVVFLALGSAEGLTNPLPFGQDIAGRNESGDQYGFTLATVKGGFHSDGLIIGTPGENVEGSGPKAGVFYYLP